MQTSNQAATNLDGDTFQDSALWQGILALVERNLASRRDRELFVETEGENGRLRKEIGELTADERRGLHPFLAGYVAEKLLDRHLAGRGYVDLVEKRRTYTKKLHELTPEDLPAIVEADRWRGEVEQDLAGFIQEAQSDLARLPVVEDGGRRPHAA